MSGCMVDQVEAEVVGGSSVKLRYKRTAVPKHSSTHGGVRRSVIEGKGTGRVDTQMRPLQDQDSSSFSVPRERGEIKSDCNHWITLVNERQTVFRERK